MLKRLFLILFLLKNFSTQGQQKPHFFSHIKDKDGLSFNIINCFLKDSKGNLWIGTFNGLNRYDGKHFYTYYNSKDENSLPHNTVQELFEDINGNIWGGTDKGVFCLNPLTGKFKRYTIPYQKEYSAVYNICYDSQKNIWATSDLYISKYNKKTDSFEQPNGLKIRFEGGVRKNGFEESPDGKGIWITTGKGLKYYDKSTEKLISSNSQSKNSIFNNHRVSALCKTPYGHYWFKDNDTDQIIGFDPLTQKIKYSINLNSTSFFNRGATLFEDKEHNLWLSTWNYELYLIDYLHGNKITRFRHDKSDITTIAGDFFWTIMQETDGTLWFGNIGGISKCNISGSFYKVHDLNINANSQETNSIIYLTENPKDSTWWFATSNKKLIKYNSKIEKIESWDFQNFSPDKTKKTPEYVNKLIFLDDKIFLLAPNGLWIKKGNGNFKSADREAPFDSQSVYEAAIEGDIFYGISGNRVLKWNLKSHQLDSIVFESETLKKSRFLTKPAFVNNKLWIITDPGQLIYAEADKLKEVRLVNNVGKESIDVLYSNFFADTKKNIWITLKGDGLIHYDAKTNKSKQLKHQDGLVNDHVMAVTEDKNGKIWTACYNQFSVYNPKLNSFYNFTLPLSENNYNYLNQLHTLKNGNIIGNIMDKLVEFYPDKYKFQPQKDKPLISMIAVNGTETSLHYQNNIDLKHFENSLQIKFGMLTDNTASPYNIQYFLEGADEKWTVSSSFEANYNSLQSGNYTFRLKAIAKDKSWESAETTLKIFIATPFYKTAWFMILCALAVAGLVYGYVRSQNNQRRKIHNLQLQSTRLEKDKTEIQYQNLINHLNPHFLFNSLTSLNSLIITEPKTASKFLQKLSSIYRYILQSKDKEAVTLEQELNFVKNYVELQKSRFENGLMINFYIPEDYLASKIVPVTLQNLFENAIKHNIIEDENPLTIIAYIEDDYLIVKNNLQKKKFVDTSNKQGLDSLKTLYSYLSPNPFETIETESEFIVKVPLI